MGNLNRQSKIVNPKLFIVNLAVWLVIFAALLAWRAQNLDAFSTFNDEGAHLMWAKLAVDGYPLYSETQAVQSPLFLEWIGLAFRLLGVSVITGRVAMLAGFGLLSAGLSGLAWRYNGWPAALVALILAGVAPLMFTLSRLVMAEVMATGLAVLSLGAMMQVGPGRGRGGWLVVSGLLFGMSMFTKALNPFVALPLAVLFFQQLPRSGSRLPVKSWLTGGLWWAAGVSLPVVVVLLRYDLPALYEQLIAFRGALRAAVPGSWGDTWGQFYRFGQTHWGFGLLALGGVVSAWRHRKNQPLTVVWLIWLFSGAAMLLWHTPLFYHHLVILLPPLIVLGAGFVADGVGVIRQRPAGWQSVGYSVVMVLAALNLPAIITANQAELSVTTGGREQEALTLLQAVSAPADFVMGDSQQLIFMAGRRTPPPLGDVALVAIKAGLQTSDNMIELTQQYRAPAVVQWSLRLPWLPDYLVWVDRHYLARRVWDNDHIIYFAPRLWPGSTIPNERQVKLGDRLTLRGYQSEPGDGVLVVKTWWRADEPLPHDYTVFTQLLDSGGALVAGWDSQPLGGYFPTTQWPAGETVIDIVQLPLPPNLPPGDYTLITGMYRLDTMERLPVPDDASGQNIITLGQVMIMNNE